MHSQVERYNVRWLGCCGIRPAPVIYFLSLERRKGIVPMEYNKYIHIWSHSSRPRVFFFAQFWIPLLNGQKEFYQFPNGKINLDCEREMRRFSHISFFLIALSSSSSSSSSPSPSSHLFSLIYFSRSTFTMAIPSLNNNRPKWANDFCNFRNFNKRYPPGWNFLQYHYKGLWKHPCPRFQNFRLALMWNSFKKIPASCMCFPPIKSNHSGCNMTSLNNDAIGACRSSLATENY